MSLITLLLNGISSSATGEYVLFAILDITVPVLEVTKVEGMSLGYHLNVFSLTILPESSLSPMVGVPAPNQLPESIFQSIDRYLGVPLSSDAPRLDFTTSPQAEIEGVRLV